jgi:hypothetical protein
LFGNIIKNISLFYNTGPFGYYSLIVLLILGIVLGWQMLKNIIFPGGGLKGWAYIGTIRALTELVDYSKIEQVIGTSIGSLFGLCYVLQIEWSYLLDFIINLDFKIFSKRETG